MTNCCAGCAEPGKYSHTTDCLFEHFLNFMNWNGLPVEEKAKVRLAYFYGKEEGERERGLLQMKWPRRMAMSEPT
jgi:hypothetical protein